MPRENKENEVIEEIKEEENKPTEENNVIDDIGNVNREIEVKEESPKQAQDDDYSTHRNLILLRGVIRSIRQELNDEDRQENVISITTPNHLRYDNVVQATVDVYWGSNERASEMVVSQFQAGDHVIVHAECRTFWNRIRRGSLLYGVSIEKDKPNELTGLGDYDPPKNETLFIGTLRSVAQNTPADRNPETSRFRFLNLVTHTETGPENNRRELVSYPSVVVAGRVAQAFNRNRKLFQEGKRIGVACYLQIRRNQETGQNTLSWIAHDLIGYDENGNTVKINLPPVFAYRAPRNTGAARRPRNVTVSPSEGDVIGLDKNQDAPDEEEKVESRDPEGVVTGGDTSPQETITYVNGAPADENAPELNASALEKDELRKRLAEAAY